MLLLNRAGHAIGIFEVSSGGSAGTILDPKIIFATALKSCAANFTIAHNHPSGNLQPSKEDLNITKRIIEAGKLLDLRLFDHLIITTDGFYSFV